jgi:hypothetical protein
MTKDLVSLCDASVNVQAVNSLPFIQAIRARLEARLSK